MALWVVGVSLVEVRPVCLAARLFGVLAPTAVRVCVAWLTGLNVVAFWVVVVPLVEVRPICLAYRLFGILAPTAVKICIA